MWNREWSIVNGQTGMVNGNAEEGSVQDKGV